MSWHFNGSISYRETVSLREKLADGGASERAMHELAAAYYNLAAFASDKEIMRKAYTVWDKLSREHPDNSDYTKYRARARSFADA